MKVNKLVLILIVLYLLKKYNKKIKNYLILWLHLNLKKKKLIFIFYINIFY